MRKGFAFTIFGIVMATAIVTSVAFAGDEEIWGTYKLISATYKLLDTGDVVNSYGEHPKGYITYGKEGRMLVLITNDGRPKPQDVLKTSIEERDALYRSMTAYRGTYTFSGNQVEHHVDISWDETRSGTTVIRKVSRDGDRLTYVTEPFATRNQQIFGKMVVQTLIWEKIH
jgi:Lipocalin-like domain